MMSLRMILLLVGLLGLLPPAPGWAADRPRTLADMSPPAPLREVRVTADLGFGYGGGNGDLYLSSEAGMSFHLGLGFPTSDRHQVHLLGYAQRIGRTGGTPTVTAYGLDFLFGMPPRAVVTGRSHGFFEGGFGFMSRDGYRKRGDLVFSVRGGTLLALGGGTALQVGVSVRPSLAVLFNVLGAEEPTGVLLGLDVGLVF